MNVLEEEVRDVYLERILDLEKNFLKVRRIREEGDEIRLTLFEKLHPS